MKKEVISDRHGIVLMTMFIIGTSSIQATGIDAKQDIWLAIILGTFMSIPILFIYARLHVIFQNKDMFDIIECCFGKVIGKIIELIITLFIIETAAEVLINFGYFVKIIGLPRTPMFLLDALMIFLCVCMVYKGIGVIGKWGEFFIIILVGFLIVSLLLLIPAMDIKNLKPVLANGSKPILKGSFAAFMFPFTETIPFTIAFSAFKRKKSPYKVYLIGLFFGSFLILGVSMINILVLGVDTASSLYHPTYFSFSKMGFGVFLKRAEVIASIIFLLGVIIKISVFLLGACRGFGKILEYKDYGVLIIPTAVLILIISHFETINIMSFYEWTAGMWNYYALIFQVIFPIIIWIIAEIKKKNYVRIKKQVE
ncbi:GerAB/ArcD/ProY family transporter [Oceanirhabdus sp. W0125-5]|uniref:GerAB/ArcD/ProY family transporter n=1 Tax=Oceanirhabdus sp. W0125-5 TaxID=2999116 RepID=UPI0022F2F8DF|nr:endospore germination permease [Oceanirhabdus sp. W0125-5]WBW95314.1 endospore germination permease [Oceanirhabdus sp. W0125-5]